MLYDIMSTKYIWVSDKKDCYIKAKHKNKNGK